MALSHVTWEAGPSEEVEPGYLNALTPLVSNEPLDAVTWVFPTLARFFWTPSLVDTREGVAFAVQSRFLTFL